MISLEEIISKVSDDDLQDAFIQIVEWRKTGVLKEGIIREVHEKFTKEVGKGYQIWRMEQDFLWEIAKRHYGFRNLDGQK